MQKSYFLLLAPLVGALVAIPARAQTPAPAPSLADLQAAKAQSDAGARLLAERLYEPAVAHFQKAYDLAHRATDLQKVAEAYRGMGDLGAAYDTYTKLLASLGAARDPAATAAKKALAELDAATGLLSVHCTSDGAVVLVGERRAGTTPLSAPIRVATGSANVAIRREGFEVFRTNVAIDPAHVATVDATLTPFVKMGHVSVREAHQADAHAVVDGQDVGPVPWEGDVLPGAHVISLRGPMLEVAAQTVKVRRGAKAEAVFLATFLSGRLQITTSPSSAAIAIDDKPVSVGTFDDQVPVGRHTVRVSAADFRAVDRQVSIEAQSTVTLGVTLEPWVSPEEQAKKQEEEDADAIRGGYGGLTFFGTYPVNAQHVDCSTLAGQATCTTGLPLSGGAAIRGGYSFGMIGIELVGAFLAEGWTDTVAYAPSSAPGTPGIAHQESYMLLSAGGMIALGPRFMTSGRHARFTMGVAGGVADREFNLSRSVSGGVYDSGASYSGHRHVVSPGLLADFGLIAGTTPGVNFTIGVQAWVDWPATQSVPSATVTESSGNKQYQTTVGPVTIENGTQVYVGPYIGLRFGH
jgi:hypothetical protein